MLVRENGNGRRTDGHDGDGQESFPKKNLCIASIGFIKDLEKGKLARV
jgi:hypothetical protein